MSDEDRQPAEARSESSKRLPSPPIWRRLIWLVIPLTILVGDIFIRWGGELGPILARENPENLPITIFVSATFWWAVSVLLPEGRSRGIWAAVITGIWALLVAMAWQYKLVIKHDPNPGVLLYFIHEPGNTAALASTGLNFTFIINFLGLWSVWSWALKSARTRGSRVITFAAIFVVAGWAVASAGWHDTRPDRETPYVSDINVNVIFARAIARGMEFGVDAILTRADRRDVVLDVVPDRDQPDVIIFVAESLRRDRIGAFGKDRDTSPRIDAFFDTYGDRVVDFDRAQAASAFTPLALATILTGQYPGSTKEEVHTHPVLWQYANALDGTSASVSTQLWTWSNLSLFFLLSHPPDTALSAGDLDADIVNDTGVDDRIAARAFARLVEDADPARPFFGVFQANSTHYPLLADDDAPWELANRQDRYDSAVRVTDEAFGIVLDALERSGRLDKTIIIFTSDHSEYDWDKIETDLPGKEIATDLIVGERIESCHPVLANVPFFVFVPEGVDLPFEQLRENRHRAVSTADVFPTVLESWGLSPTAAGAAPDGVSLLQPIPEDRRVFCFTAPPWARWLLTGVAIFDSKKAVYVREDFEHPQVFDLDDPDLYREQFAGEAPTDADRAWLEESADHPIAGPYLEWGRSKSPP